MRMRLFNPGSIISLFVFAAFFAFAPDALAQAASITLKEAYGLALEKNEQIRIVSEDLSQAEAVYNRTLSNILPKVTAEGGYTVFSEEKASPSGFIIQPENSSRFDLRITQPLYSGGREWSLRRQARFNIRGIKEARENVQEDILLRTADAYYGALKSEKDIEIKRAALRRAEERLKVANSRFRVGDVTKSVVLRAESELAGAEAELTRSMRDYRDRSALLARLLGLDADPSTLTLEEPEKKEPPAKAIDELVAEALENRNDYKQIALQERAAKENIRFVKGAFLPSLRLEGLYSWRDQEPETTFFQDESISGTVTLSYPIFEGGLRLAELKEAKSVFRESELRSLALRRDIEVQVRQAANAIEAITAVIESYKRQVAFAEENYKMVFEQFKYGLATSVDITDADAVLVSAQRSYSSSVYDLQLAIASLQRVSGVLLEKSME